MKRNEGEGAVRPDRLGDAPGRFARVNTSEVFDLKPTSGRPRLFVKSGDGDHSGIA